MNDKLTTGNIISWSFGLLVITIGIINTCWGNDQDFGIFILSLSLVYLLPINTILQKIAEVAIPGMGILKIILGIFILWASLGVGELFDKIELMRMNF